MHEGAIAEQIIRIVKDELSKQSSDWAVEKISLSIGKMNAIVPSSLQFFFDVIKVEHPRLKESVLDIKQLPILASCATCSRSFEIEEPLFICSQCGAALAIESGKDMHIEKISFRSEKEGCTLSEEIKK
ncbi:MAG: hydrogenase maturation nickel metallochaperone HypA [Deltaproteobacteria bacterium]|nr:hydrogenase maturation nickel metallochaperone HypA [Deltaproteobacteria bacterium]